jgi:hypothetical protein
MPWCQSPKPIWGAFKTDLVFSMVTLTTNPIPGFFGQYCAVVPRTDPANFIAVGITPGQTSPGHGIAVSWPAHE